MDYLAAGAFFVTTGSIFSLVFRSKRDHLVVLFLWIRQFSDVV